MPPLSLSQRVAGVALCVLYPGWVFVSSPIVWGIPWEGFFAFVVPLLYFASALPAMIGLAALWCIWGPVRPAVRFAIVAAVAAALDVVWLIGFFIASDDRNLLLGNAIFLLTLPGVLAAAAVPPWILRLVFGFRLVHPSGDSATSPRANYSIGSIMAVTTLVAVALAASRISLTIDEISPQPQQMLSFAVGWAWTASISLASLVPAVLMILWPRRWATTCILVSAYFLAAIVVVLLLFSESSESMFFYARLLSIFTIALILPLLFARWIGYRLVRRA